MEVIMTNLFDLEAYGQKARRAVAEGIVLLENEGEVLPLKEGSRAALFGRSQFNYFKSGTGSGGLVNTGHIVDIAEALCGEKTIHINQTVRAAYEEWLKDHPFDEGNGWATEPWFQEEMPLSSGLVEEAAKESDAALIFIGRTAGEDKDNKAEGGSYLLTDTEEDMIRLVCSVFEKTIVLLNTGNIIDMKWVGRYHPGAVLYVWQGGQEGGRGTVDVLTGRVSPSGKLPDTIAYDITDYPSTANYGSETRNRYEEDIYVGYRYFETFAKDKVLYPFGFGLSYTTFLIDEAGLKRREGSVSLRVRVTNTGKMPGKEVVQVYCEAPQGELGKPVRSLAGFAKTDLLEPGESRMVTVECPEYYFSSYDDSGVSGYRSCYVLEAGEYTFYVGSDVRSAKAAGSFVIEKTRPVRQLTESMAPNEALRRMKPERTQDGYRITYEEAPLRTVSLNERITSRRPAEAAYTGDRGFRLIDVAECRTGMEDFIAQLSDQDLCCLVRGEGMCSPKVTPGTAGAFGGVTEELKAFGIPVGCCADGPSGIRMDCGTIAFSMPNGTCLASTFNEKLIQELYEFEGLELRKNHIDTLLGPGMNLHRNPLNGRNFEYFSEDPLLTGKMAAAQLKGMHKYQVTGTIKHFACNSQEYRRNDVEALVSERALRELYLKGFEIAVREGGAYCIMTAYCPINGYWSASNYDLLTTILRDEWGFTGMVMTDWWARGNDEGQPGDRKNMAAMIQSQNDVYMVTESAARNTNKDNSEERLADGTAFRADYQRSAANICRVLMRMPAFARFLGRRDELDEGLKAWEQEEEGKKENSILVQAGADTALDVSLLDTEKGRSTLYQIAVREPGEYRLVLTLRSAAESGLAQIPLSLFHNRELLKTITLEGGQKEWRTETAELGRLGGYQNYLRFYFGQSGMEVGEARLERV